MKSRRFLVSYNVKTYKDNVSDNSGGFGDLDITINGKLDGDMVLDIKKQVIDRVYDKLKTLPTSIPIKKENIQVVILSINELEV